jgi:hypothetical protein
VAKALWIRSPQQISRQLLAQAVAYRLQVKALGGINFSTRRASEKITEEKNSKTNIETDDGLKPGIVLVRVWHGGDASGFDFARGR